MRRREQRAGALGMGGDTGPARMVEVAFYSLYRVAGGKQGAALHAGRDRAGHHRGGLALFPWWFSAARLLLVHKKQTLVPQLYKPGPALHSQQWVAPQHREAQQADSDYHPQGLTNGKATGLIPTEPQ